MVARYRNFYSVSEKDFGETRLGVFWAGVLAMIRAEDMRAFVDVAHMRTAFMADNAGWAKFIKESMPT